MPTISSFTFKISGVAAYTDGTSGPFESSYSNGIISNPFESESIINFSQLYTDEPTDVDALQELLTLGAPGGKYLNFIVSAPSQDKTISSWWMDISGIVAYDDQTYGSYCVQYRNGSFNDVYGKTNFHAILADDSASTVIVNVIQSVSSGSTVSVPNRSPTDIAISVATIAENNAIGAVIGTLSTTDPDTGNSFTYTLVSGAGDTNNASFTIDGVSLKANAAFNFESKSSYTVRVRSTDQGGLYYEKAFTITVTNVNEAPTDIAISASTIAENNAIGAVIGTLSTTDPDAGNSFTYSLVSGTGDTNNASFTILGSSLKANAVFDYETKNSYTVRVRSTDQGGLTTEKAFTISVTDVSENQAPTDISISASTIAENNAIGAVIGTLSTTDPDAGNSFTYTLVSGTGDTDNASFSISGSDLIANEVFDFETKSSYSIRVRSTDQGGLTTGKAFTITVTNVNEVPTYVTLSANTIAENNEIGAVIGTFSTTDQDAGDTFTYTLTETIGGSELDNASFSIDGANLIANVVFDYEAKSTYYIHVRSTDQGGLWTGQEASLPPGPSDIGWRFTITVTDVSENQAPTDISLSNNAKAERNFPPDTPIGQFSTTDPDVGDTFTYTLVSGEGDTDNATFNIAGLFFGPYNGFYLMSNIVLDFETKNSYAIRVRTTDQGGLYYEKPFTITVIDVEPE